MLNYNKGNKDLKNWLVEEETFEEKFLGKTESIFSQGNGYIGLRSSTVENYVHQVRNMFVNGTFNKADENEVTELPNAADILELEISLNNHIMNLQQGEVSNYSKVLNLKTGELIRSFIWNYENIKIKFESKRFVSLANKRVIGQKISIENLNSNNLNIKILSGINGQVTNTGAMHFNDGQKRLIEGKYLNMHTKTSESQIDFIYNLAHKFNTDVDSMILMERRKIFNRYEVTIKEGQTFKMEKISNVTTSRDNEYIGLDEKELFDKANVEIKKLYNEGYEKLFKNNLNAWEEYWDNSDIVLNGNDFDQLAIRFALYHMRVFTPFHDNRMNIGAKGLSGEGYKGHTFWDTEIFAFPPQVFTNPQVARQLLEYRYFGLKGAREKAKGNNYEGAQYPWEAAWIDDGEVTPVWGAADIITGESTKIWSGFIEQHITADIAYAIWLYEKVTNDIDFMEKMGYEILFETANFWVTRAEYNKDKDRFELHDVIGPNEYKEHVDNDAFTNYMAKFNVEYAIEVYNIIKGTNIEENLKKYININNWNNFVDKIYLPGTNNEKVIAENDTFLSLENIDLSKYKNQDHVGSLFEDYNLEQVNNMQICKQADVLLLLLLKENLFDDETKKANWDYYEPKTLHDSSLSLSTHAILANDMKNQQLADKLFKSACEIDLGTNMKSSDHGIHAASLAGIWQCIVYGYGGVRMVDNHLRIIPQIKRDWNDFNFNIKYLGIPLKIKITKNEIEINNLGNEEVQIESINKKIYTVKAQHTVVIGV